MIYLLMLLFSSQAQSMDKMSFNRGLHSPQFSVTQLTQKSLSTETGVMPQGVIGFPVKSTAHTGVVHKRHVSLDLQRALFVIGDDERSRSWLDKNQRRLQQLDALGLMTNVESPSRLHRLSQRYGLAIVPARVDTLLKTLEVSAYPFLYTQGEISQ